MQPEIDAIEGGRKGERATSLILGADGKNHHSGVRVSRECYMMLAPVLATLGTARGSRGNTSVPMHIYPARGKGMKRSDKQVMAYLGGADRLAPWTDAVKAARETLAVEFPGEKFSVAKGGKLHALASSMYRRF